MGLPAGYASLTAEDVGVVTGHTVFVDIVQYDEDLAAVAGIASQKVVWFNGVIVMDKKENGWVYAAEADAPDPSKERLYSTGNWYNFTDPNGGNWSVAEFYFFDLIEGLESPEGFPIPESLAKTFTWAVRVTPEPLFDPTLARDYNFVTIIDTTLLNERNEDGVAHDGSEPGHEDGEAAHDHSSAQVDLFFRTTDPVSICANCGGGE